MSSSKSRGTEWMYQDATSKAELKKNEEESYLLGKEYRPKGAKTGDLAVGHQSTAMSRIVENAGNQDGLDHHHRNESFLRQHEDPMFMVNQTRKEKERDQRKKKELFEKASCDYRGRSRRKSRSRADRGERSISPSYSSSEEERRGRKRKKDRKRKKKRHRSYSTDSEDSKYKRRRRRKHDRKDRRRDRDRNESKSRSPSPHSDSKGKRRSKRERSESDGHHDMKSKRQHTPERKNGNDEKPKVEREGFGLLGKGSKKFITSVSLGPDEALLAKKRQEKEDARQRYRRRDRNQRTKMSDEERRAALNAMQSDGDDRAALLSKSSTAEKVDLHDEEIQRRMREGSKEVSTFVQDLVMKTHAIGEDNGPSLARQLQQNRNYIQKASDDNFL